MATHPVPGLDVTADDGAILTTWSHSHILPQRLVTRHPPSTFLSGALLE